jgi:hypothetical protein
MGRRWTQPQHRPNPERAARSLAASLLGDPAWWVTAARLKRSLRRAERNDPSNSRLTHATRRAFTRHATRRGLAALTEEDT